MVLDEGLLFRTNESAFVETKRKLVDECDLWAIVSMPGGVFSTAGAGVKTNLLFFTKGRKTEKIWYYDLSQVKIGKKTPMTLAHFGFGRNGEILDEDKLPADLVAEWAENVENKGKAFPSYAGILANRGTSAGESSFSWTVDFARRRADARSEMQPHLDKAGEIKSEVVSLKEKLKVLKKAKANAQAVGELEEQIRIQEKAAREEEAKATEIDAKVFDLKAVNPNAVAKTDTRSVEEIIQNIEIQGRIVEEAMKKLRSLIDVCF